LLARSFDAGPGAYARFRPGYPPAAVRAALPGDARDVLDLGAGTGKLTESLLGRGLQVTAVEPLPGMLAELSRRFPQATAVPGSAEDIPLPDGAVDCVVVGQAFHWFDPDRALAEIARGLSVTERYQAFTRGIISLRGLIYFASFIGFWLFVNTVIVDYRKAD